MEQRLTVEAAMGALAAASEPFAAMFRHGSLEVEIYRPLGQDRQTPHRRDELYVVIAGHGRFFCDGTRRPFQPGEVLFAPAGVEHRGVQRGLRHLGDFLRPRRRRTGLMPGSRYTARSLARSPPP